MHKLIWCATKIKPRKTCLSAPKHEILPDENYHIMMNPTSLSALPIDLTHFQALQNLSVNSEFLHNFKHRTLTITNIIENVRLVDPSSPNPNHVLIAIDKQLQPCSVPFIGDTAQVQFSIRGIHIINCALLVEKGVGRDPIRTTAEYADVVNFEEEG